MGCVLALGVPLLLAGVFVGLLPRVITVRIKNEGAPCTEARPAFIGKSTQMTVCDGDSKDWVFLAKGSEFLILRLSSESGSSEWFCEYLDATFTLRNDIDLIVHPDKSPRWRWTRRPDISSPCSPLNPSQLPSPPS